MDTLEQNLVQYWVQQARNVVRQLRIDDDECCSGTTPTYLVAHHLPSMQHEDDEFRRCVAQFMRWHLDSMSLGEVIGRRAMASSSTVAARPLGLARVAIW